MKSSYIIAITIIIVIVVIVVIILIIATTNRNPVLTPSSGTDSLGSWVRIGTASGVLKSYVVEGIFTNPQGESLTIVGDRIILKPEDLFTGYDTYWVFDGQFLSSNGYYFNVNSTTGQVFLSTFPQTPLLFDSYNFYLTNSIIVPKAKVIDPNNLHLQNTTSNQIYLETSQRWMISTR